MKSVATAAAAVEASSTAGAAASKTGKLLGYGSDYYYDDYCFS